ncbi:MAG TPA: hypothetical protein VEK08_16680 [Planctomycetota bacterium]|nr:hypothetical protein [Planctomycetota bacterium]
MVITYCSQCGARLRIAALKEGEEPKCQDCISGKPRRPRSRDSAMIPKRRQSTGTILRTIQKDVKLDENK